MRRDAESMPAMQARHPRTQLPARVTTPTRNPRTQPRATAQTPTRHARAQYPANVNTTTRNPRTQSPASVTTPTNPTREKNSRASCMISSKISYTTCCSRKSTMCSPVRSQRRSWRINRTTSTVSFMTCGTATSTTARCVAAALEHKIPSANEIEKQSSKPRSTTLHRTSKRFSQHHSAPQHNNEKLEARATNKFSTETERFASDPTNSTWHRQQKPPQNTHKTLTSHIDPVLQPLLYQAQLCSNDVHTDVSHRSDPSMSLATLIKSSTSFLKLF